MSSLFPRTPAGASFSLSYTPGHTPASSPSPAAKPVAHGLPGHLKTQPHHSPSQSVHGDDLSSSVAHKARVTVPGLPPGPPLRCICLGCPDTPQFSSNTEENPSPPSVLGSGGTSGQPPCSARGQARGSPGAGTLPVSPSSRSSLQGRQPRLWPQPLPPRIAAGTNGVVARVGGSGHFLASHMPLPGTPSIPPCPLLHWGGPQVSPCSWVCSLQH